MNTIPVWVAFFAGVLCGGIVIGFMATVCISLAIDFLKGKE